MAKKLIITDFSRFGNPAKTYDEAGKANGIVEGQFTFAFLNGDKQATFKAGRENLIEFNAVELIEDTFEAKTYYRLYNAIKNSDEVIERKAMVKSIKELSLVE